MTKQAWFHVVATHKDELRSLIVHYHPVNLHPHKPTDKLDKSITAPSAERYCEVVRNKIRSKASGRPEVQFDLALKNKDDKTMSALLSDAWFGIPESRACVNIPGFGILCDLLDDPIEE